MAHRRADKRKLGEGDEADKRIKTLSDLASISGISKTGLAKALNLLNDRGLLTNRLSNTPTVGQYRRGVQKAVESHGLHTHTPYGTLIQEMELPTSKMPSWHYISPFALLSHLCSINGPLFNLVAHTVQQFSRLRIIIYIDEVNPGNPLAPDVARKVEAIYWTFAELPVWFLSRKDSWFCFGILRSGVVLDIEGGVSALMRLVLRQFWSERGDSWDRGCCIQHNGASVQVVASFCGFLADEKGLKEVYDIKGQAGSVPCPTCLNVRNRWVNVSGGDLVHMWDPDRTKRVFARDAHFHAKVKKLSESTNRKQLETQLGMNYSPNGILFDTYLMTHVLSPTRNYLRDWMHTLASSGVAGTHLAVLCGTLSSIGISLDIVRSYGKKFVMPRSRGKVSDLFFKPELVSTDHVRHFASDVLGMCTLMYCFLIEKVKPRGLLVDNIECFICLYTMFCILRRGEMTKEIHAVFNAIVDKHARLFLTLYGAEFAKVKFHHLYHLADDLLYMLKCIGCFVTERKNKDVKAIAMSTSRHLERTATCAFLQKTLQHFRDNAAAASPAYLKRASEIQLPPDLTAIRAPEAVLKCGDVFENDHVLLVNGTICKVIEFFGDKDESELLVGVLRYEKHPSLPLRWDLVCGSSDVINCDSIVEPVAWYSVTHTSIVVAMPCFDY